MKLLITDIKSEKMNLGNEIDIVEEKGEIKNCIGCFGCWVKTPGRCVLKDEYINTGERMAKAEELIIISKGYYGTFSPFIKSIIDRSISYVMPFFETRNNETHHVPRYEKKIKMKIMFYGDITEEEKETSRKLVKANAINFNTDDYNVMFFENEKEAIEEANRI